MEYFFISSITFPAAMLLSADDFISTLSFILTGLLLTSFNTSSKDGTLSPLYFSENQYPASSFFTSSYVISVIFLATPVVLYADASCITTI